MPRRILLRPGDTGLAWVQAQAATFQEAGNPAPPVLELPGVVVKQDEVVHIAQVALRTQDFLAEVVQAVQVEVGEELAGQVPDGRPRRRSKGVNRSSPG